jgi:hypothetical protein
MGEKTFKNLSLMILAAAVILFPASVFAEGEQITIGPLTFELRAEEAVVVRCSVDTEGSVEIPAEVKGFPVKTIGADAFYFCEKVTQVQLPGSIENIEENAFFRCFGLKDIVLPEGLKKVGTGAFSFCAAEDISLPASLEYLGDGVFYGIHTLKDINVSAENKFYLDIDGVLFDKGQNTLICYPAGKTNVFYDVPSSVTTVKAYAFTGSTSLLQVEVPERTVIEENAFFRCLPWFQMTEKDSVAA